VQGLLVITEIGLALLLLVGRGLLIHSFINMTNVNPGNDQTNLLTFNVPTTAGVAASFIEDLVAQLQLLPASGP
jgi:hypothetical protein